MTSRLATRRTVLTAALGSLALAGCSSTSSSGKSSSTGSADPKKHLTAAQNLLATTSGYHVKITSKLPQGFSENGIGHGEGDVAPKAQSFKGKVVVLALGSSIDADIVCIADTTWYKTGVQSAYQEFDTTKYNVPQPARLFSTTKGLPALLTKSTDVKENGKKLVSGQQVTMYKGTIDAMTVTSTIGFGRSRSPYTMEVGLDDKDRPLTMTITGPFYDSADASYTTEMSKFDEKLSIAKPV